MDGIRKSGGASSGEALPETGRWGKPLSQKPLREPGEIVFAIIILAFSAAALWQAYEISGFTGLSTPGIFPMLAAGTMLLSAFFILYDTLRKSPPDAAEYPIVIRFFREVTPWRLVLMVAMIVGYMLAMPRLGFTISSGLFLFFSFTLLWRSNPFVSLLMTAITLAVVTGIFRVVFQVVLPHGEWVQGLF
jgi:hypothetical protein